ncbi:MAG TPA: MarR family transcriptional regulator [Polyangiaceae bacterium]|jgi:DNA-binding MarR family transcriptional regulator|nr:MarR family transcriptional regulator [Polyangiaceae bacterium]
MSAHHEFLAICRTVALWQNRAEAELGAIHGIGLSDFAAMHHLAEAPTGRLRRVDLAQRLALTPSGVTRLLAPLERRGIVTREDGGHDARATYAVLTRSGKALVKDATATMNTVAESILGSLGDRDRATFAKLVSP